MIYHTAREFIARRITSMVLFGEAINPINKVYEALGGEKIYAENGEFRGGYRWNDLKKLVLIQ